VENDISASRQVSLLSVGPPGMQFCTPLVVGCRDLYDALASWPNARYVVRVVPQGHAKAASRP
jgi:hypothetical protein